MSRLQTITSVSGGKPSAYLAANYPCDDLVFSLVRIEDQNCLFLDKKTRQLVEDRIQAPFILRIVANNKTQLFATKRNSLQQNATVRNKTVVQ